MCVIYVDFLKIYILLIYICLYVYVYLLCVQMFLEGEEFFRYFGNGVLDGFELFLVSDLELYLNLIEVYLVYLLIVFWIIYLIQWYRKLL